MPPACHVYGNSLGVDLHDGTSLYACMKVQSQVTEPNYCSALRVVFPTRLTIVRSLLWSNVHIGNKQPKVSFFKYGFVTLKLC